MLIISGLYISFNALSDEALPLVADGSLTLGKRILFNVQLLVSKQMYKAVMLISIN